MDPSTQPHLSLVSPTTRARPVSSPPPVAGGKSGQWSYDQVRASFLRDGQLVPPPRVPQVATDRGALSRLAAADALVVRSRAHNTRVAYGACVAKWVAWAEEKGVPALPADPQDVAAYLVAYAFGDDASAQAALVGRVSAASVNQQLAAINRLHVLAGFPTPGSSGFLSDMMRGLRRTLGTAPRHAKAALTWDLVERMVEPRPARSAQELRRKTIVALSRATQATPGQIARLRWPAVELGAGAVALALPPTRPGSPEQRVSLSGRSRASREAVRLLRAWRDESVSWPGDLVFKTEDGRGLTRQGVHKLVRAREGAADLDAGTATAQEVRDRALILVGWTIAQRRTNLSELDWENVTATRDRGWRIAVNRSKSDQEGHGTRVAVPPPPPGSGIADAAAALASWLEIVRKTLGVDPRQSRGIPLFCRIDNGDTLRMDDGRLCRLSGAAINEIVQNAAARAGVTASFAATGHQLTEGRNPFGAHSLRSGFVTEGASRGIPLEVLIGQTGHKDVRSALPYYKPAQGPDLIAASALMAAIASGESHDESASPPPQAPRPRRGLAAGGWGPGTEGAAR